MRDRADSFPSLSSIAALRSSSWSGPGRRDHPAGKVGSDDLRHSRRPAGAHRRHASLADGTGPKSVAAALGTHSKRRDLSPPAFRPAADARATSGNQPAPDGSRASRDETPPNVSRRAKRPRLGDEQRTRQRSSGGNSSPRAPLPIEAAPPELERVAGGVAARPSGETRIVPIAISSGGCQSATRNCVRAATASSGFPGGGSWIPGNPPAQTPDRDEGVKEEDFPA